MKIIEVVAYNSAWPEMFQIEAAVIQKALGETCVAIHHVGSTSVPGLAAKPKIDIIAIVCDLFFQESHLSTIGYTYRGGFNIPLRRSFNGNGINLHVFEENDPEIELNILFRDYLRKNRNARAEYEALKYNLLLDESSHQKNNSIYTGYTLGKHDFIQNILKQAGFKALRFVLCTYAAEWDVAKHLRQKYFFDKVEITDPYTWTFNHPDHKHLVLYQGTEIIGYAHIVLWPEARAAMRIIVIDEPHRNKNFGEKFLHLCEKWLKSKGYNSMHVESSPAALAFYKKNGYTEMPFNDPDGYEGGAEDIALGKKL